MAETRTKSGGNTRSSTTARRANRARSAPRGQRSNGSRSTTASARGTGPRAGKRTPPKRAGATAARSQAQTVEAGQGTSFGDIVSKAKTPLIAGGAAAAGLVGGVALSRNSGKKGFSMPQIGGKRRAPNISLPKMPSPQLGKSDSTRKALGATAKALGNTAVEIGKAGYRVGELTSEVRRVREQARND
jgi:hypothetical protein